MKFYQDTDGNQLDCNHSQKIFLGKFKEIKKKGINFNGFGYSDYLITVELTEEQREKFASLGKAKPQKNTDPKTAWVNRLTKLTGIESAEALEIADEKIAYKEEQIRQLHDAQVEHYSTRRQSLINKITRQNPLRRIVDLEHAQAILAAHKRHTTTDYDDKLQEAKELASKSLIDHGEVKEWARENYT
jgi:hypothetical protein